MKEKEIKIEEIEEHKGKKETCLLLSVNARALEGPCVVWRLRRSFF